MAERIKRVVGWTAVLVIGLNVQDIAHLFRVDGLLATTITLLPSGIARVGEVVTNRWALAASTFVVGLIVGDWLVRRALHLERAPGTLGAVALGWKRMILLFALRHPATFGRLVDVRHELATFDAALTEPHLDMPRLPCTDPADIAGVSGTIRYLSVIGSLRPRHREEARRRAKAIVSDLSVAAPPTRLRSLVRRFMR